MDIKEFAFRRIAKYVEKCKMTEDCMCAMCEQERADDWADNGFDDGLEDIEEVPAERYDEREDDTPTYSDRKTPIDTLIRRFPR